MGVRGETLNYWLIQRSTAACLVLIFIITNVFTLILLNFLLFWHIHMGMEEILADYVHHEVIRDCILIILRIFLLVAIKDFCLFFVLY
nr:succinate dehydrogenase cytochrome subunit 4 [Haplopteris ensiformis]UQV94659.1 succinate dehydrogenase cytochrome subunit 4 [Haplopteris ensiformis]